jgi:hypothetical protein
MMAAIIPSVNLVYYLQPSAGRMTGKPEVEMCAQLNVRVADHSGATAWRLEPKCRLRPLLQGVRYTSGEKMRESDCEAAFLNSDSGCWRPPPLPA